MKTKNIILVIDNYDSFTYNLVQYIGELGQKIVVKRNDKINLKEIEKLKPEKILISPGPGRPEDAGISCDVIKKFGINIPVLGVCLGHQCIGQVFGSRVIKAKKLMHGKVSMVYHGGKELFKGIKNPFQANRYHSLILENKSLPECLKITAYTKQKEIMGIKHDKYPIWGVQFHPESILTESGMKILKNFINL